MTALSPPQGAHFRERAPSYADTVHTYDESSKSVYTVDAKLVDHVNDSTTDTTYWQPGFRARFPWIGFGAICTMLVCIALSLVVLITSDGLAKEEWPGSSVINRRGKSTLIL
jgi:hypothetical protein